MILPWQRKRVEGVTDALTGEESLRLCKHCKHMRRDKFFGIFIPLALLLIPPLFIGIFFLRRNQFAKCGHPDYIRITETRDYDHLVDGRGISRRVEHSYCSIVRRQAGECGQAGHGFKPRAWWKIW